MRDRDTALRYLTGALTGGARPDAVGKKFTEDGAPLPCPGYTTLCHIDPTSDAFAALVAAQDVLRRGPTADAFTFLPPESFHMTMFEGVIDYARAPERWPRHLPTNAPLAQVIDDAATGLAPLTLTPRFSLRISGLFAGFSVSVTGADDQAEAALRAARDQLREASNILRPDHDSYQFHITLGYLLRWLTPKEAESVLDISDGLGMGLTQRVPRLEVGPIEFCRFDTMRRFETRALIEA